MSTSVTSAEAVPNSDSQPDWKQEASARLSAHRTRRGSFSAQQTTLPGIETNQTDGHPGPRANVAARVAERYANTPTYSQALAAEAAKAVHAAAVAAEAAQAAREAAEAVSNVLRAEAEARSSAGAKATEQVYEGSARKIEFNQYSIDPTTLPAARQQLAVQSQSSSVDPHPHVFDPLEEALVAPALPLPARVLEFPRELVAARKARPRLAEGPLRDSPDSEKAQLRIFEVEQEAISHEPLSTDEQPMVPEWSTIRLDATPRHIEPVGQAIQSIPAEETMRASQGGARSADRPFSSRAGRPAAAAKRSSYSRTAWSDMSSLHVASLGDRLTAALVDAGLVVFAFLLFAGIFAACTTHLPSGKPVMLAAAAALVGFFALYQWLFFTYAESTPGMRFAKIALCTFNDENPGRLTLQHRIGAFFLSALPFGLGFLWALLDEDRLGWHDRMTRTYQRSYR